MMPVYVTAHAIERYRRRVENVSDAEVICRLSGPSIQGAITAGACGVLLPSGHRAVIKGSHIVTVKPKHKCKRNA